MCGGSTLNTQPKGTVVERELRGSCNSNFFFFFVFLFCKRGATSTGPPHLSVMLCGARDPMGWRKVDPTGPFSHCSQGSRVVVPSGWFGGPIEMCGPKA